MSDADVVLAVKKVVDESGMKYTHLSRKTNIEYQRLMRIFNQGAVMSGTELLRICAEVKVDPSTLLSGIRDSA